MDDSDDSNHEDVWSPTLREDIFSNHDMIGNTWSVDNRHRLEHLPLPNFNSIRSQPLNHINWPNSQSHQQQRGHNDNAPAKSSSSSSRHPLSTASVNRNRSHFDLPNFPLQTVCMLWDQVFLTWSVLRILRHNLGAKGSRQPLEQSQCSACCLEKENNTNSEVFIEPGR